MPIFLLILFPRKLIQKDHAIYFCIKTMSSNYLSQIKGHFKRLCVILRNLFKKFTCKSVITAVNYEVFLN